MRASDGLGDAGDEASTGSVRSAKRSRSSQDGPVPQSAYDPYRAFQIFLFPATGGLLFGYDIGATSVVLTQLQDAELSGTTWYGTVADSALLQGFITSSGVIGALIGSIIIFAIADDIGRKNTMLIAAIFYLVGAIIEAISGISTASSTTGLSLLLTGSIIYGLGCGFAMHGAPAYIGEMAPSSIRGVLVSLKEAFIVLGMVLGYSIGYGFDSVVGGWRYTFAMQGIIAIVFFAGVWSLPYSARWLALKGRNDEAKLSLQFVTPNITQVECQEVYDMAEEARKINEAANAAIDMERGDPPTLERWSKVLQRDYKQFNQPAVRAALTAGIGVVVFQQITGQPSVLYYANTLFESIGVTGAASIGVSVFKLLMTLGTTITVDKYGRKLLLNIGCSIMLVALALLAILFALPTTDTTQVFILIALVLYIGGYQLGFGPIAWLFISEIFPLEVRGKAVSLAVITNFFWNVVTSLIFPTEVALIGESATFVIYGVILVLGMIFINRFVPETKGLTLEDITRLFEGQAAEEERRLQEERNSSPEDVNSPLIETTEEGRKEENNQMAI